MRRSLINLFRFSDYGNKQSQYKSNYSNDNVYESKIDVKNYNLQISLENWVLSLYLVPPVLIKKGASIFEIKKANAVMGMLFIPKMGDETNWGGRKAMNFKLMDVGKLLYAAPRSGKSTIISTASLPANRGLSSGNQILKQLIIRDDAQKQTISMTLKEFPIGTLSQGVEPAVDIKISHQQYVLLFELIKASLFEVSGWKFQMDLYKKDIMNRALSKKSASGLDQDIEDIISRKGF